MTATKKHRLLDTSDGIHGIHGAAYATLSALYSATISGLTPTMTVADVGRVAYVLADRQMYVLRHQAPASPGGPLVDANLEWEILTPEQPFVAAQGSYTGWWITSPGQRSNELDVFFEAGGPGSVPIDGGGHVGFDLPDPRTAELPGYVFRIHDSGGGAFSVPIRVGTVTGLQHCFADPAGPSDMYHYVDLTVGYGSLTLRWMPHSDSTRRKWLVCR